jgi:hypothetical protein
MSCAGAKSSDDRIEDVDFARERVDLPERTERAVRAEGMSSLRDITG